MSKIIDLKKEPQKELVGIIDDSVDRTTGWIQIRKKSLKRAVRMLPDWLEEAGLPQISFYPASDIDSFLIHGLGLNNENMSCVFYAVHNDFTYLLLLTEKSEEESEDGRIHYSTMFLRSDDEGCLEGLRDGEWMPCTDDVRACTQKETTASRNQ